MSVDNIRELEEGDEIEIDARKTPMTVVSKFDTVSGGGVEIVAKNRYGSYRLRQHEGDVSILLRSGGDLSLEGTVSVQRTSPDKQVEVDE